MMSILVKNIYKEIKKDLPEELIDGKNYEMEK